MTCKGFPPNLAVTFTIYLGQIHKKSPEVNSSWVLFYLGKNSGKVTLVISAIALG